MFTGITTSVITLNRDPFVLDPPGDYLQVLGHQKISKRRV